MCFCYVKKPSVACGVCYNQQTCLLYSFCVCNNHLDAEYILQRIQFQEHLLAQLERAYKDKIYPTFYMVKKFRGLAVNVGMIGNWN